VILGIGHDICDQRRIAELLNRFDTRFINRILTKQEQAELAKRNQKEAYFAGRFAVKEAVYKALAGADQSNMRWHHAATLSNSSGAPHLILSGACLAGAEALLPAGQDLRVFASISDEPPYSSAFVVLSAEPSQ
jgi:holo-[acyl-carrier protein] synthase